MKRNYYITGFAALLLCTACNKEELLKMEGEGGAITFSATLETPDVIRTRAQGDDKGEVVALPYISGIHVRKMEKPAPLNEEYKVRNGNKGTLDVKDGQTALQWTSDEKTNDTEIHFFSWTTPDGVTLVGGTNPTTGTIDFGDEAGNRSPKGTGESDIHKINDDYVAPLEVFISAHTSGSYKGYPTISLPYTHPVSKVSIQVYNWDNQEITDNVTIKFPLINKVWTIEQVQDEGQEKPFAVTEPQSASSETLSLTLNKLWSSGNYRIFYLPPMTGNYTFDKAGNFEITYNGETFHGTLNSLDVKKLNAGEHLVCRIDLNKNYGTGVGAYINPWIFGNEETAYANPYRGIYSLEGLRILGEYIKNGNLNSLPDSLYIEDGGKKVVRLYNDLNVSGMDALSLSGNIEFDGLGHIITTSNGKNLFEEVNGPDITIRNIRMIGDGLLANTIEEATLFNCHAGAANLVGTAKGSVNFNFCSAENTNGTLMTTADGANITVSNSFVASSAKTFAGTGTATINNSFIINGTDGTYWGSTPDGTDFIVETNNCTATKVGADLLITLLNNASKQNASDTKSYWVYVYGKNYPVMRIQ